MAAYTQASRAVYEVFDDTSPVVEALSIDEAFLDVRGLEHISGTPEIAAGLRRDVLDRVGLKISVGVARTKFLAKVASGGLEAGRPAGCRRPDEEAAFLHPLPIERLWGVGKVTSQKLHEWGSQRSARSPACREASLVAALGPDSRAAPARPRQQP